MSDDIDIEEHDVLDNPRIKNIFPDLSKIKIEVHDPDDDDRAMCFSTSINQQTSFRNAITFEDDNYTMHNNKIILGSKPSLVSIENEASHYDNNPLNGVDDIQVKVEQEEHIEDLSFEELHSSDIDEEFEDSNDHNSMILLGSRPTSNMENAKINSSFVYLEDWGPRLQRSSCYCKSCEILFPTRNCLDAHKMSAHSFLVALQVNRAIKSTAKSFELKNTARKRTGIVTESVTSRSKYCNHCNKTFSDDDTLIKHLYKVLTSGRYKCTECDATFNKETEYKFHLEKHKTDEGEVFKCYICGSQFKTETKCKNHLRYFHGTRENQYELTKSKGNCAFCSHKSGSNQSLNRHIKEAHHHIFAKKVKERKLKPVKTSQVKTIQTKKWTPKMQAQNLQQSSQKYQCRLCKEVFPNYWSTRGHRQAKHAKHQDKILFIRLPFAKNNSQARKMANLNNETKTLIPKCILFKCVKCSTHFTNCLGSVLHSKTCLEIEGDWKCSTCKRTFKSNDKQIHLRQHALGGKILVHIADETIYGRTLSKCPQCNMHFHESDFWKHVKTCGSSKLISSNRFNCKFCKLIIHASSISVHNKWHKKAGTSKANIIVIEYARVEMKNMNEKNEINLKRKIDDEEITFPLKKQKVDSQKKLLIYYCSNCKCNFRLKKNSLVNYHLSKQCKNISKIMVCKMCGLFTSSSQHIRLHKDGIKLQDFEFVRIQDRKTINPPVPIYPKCKKCHVHFLTKTALQQHDCNEDHKTCTYCDKKFSDFAYKLHVPFHEYAHKYDTLFKKSENLSLMLKKYESLQEIWNILYMCEHCNVVCDSYDKVVEHCQDHYNKMESYDMIIDQCQICNLNFDSVSLQNHSQLHASRKLTEESFNILKYDYTNLLSDTWLNIFDDLSKEQVNQIVSRSIYSHSRDIKMRIIQDGVIKPTLYKCLKCKKHVSPENVSTHCNSTICTSAKRGVECSTCKEMFVSAECLYLHVTSHSPDDTPSKRYRTVVFNDTTDVFFNRELKQEDAKKYLIYKCKNCNNCMRLRDSVRIHVCRSPDWSSLCVICNLYFAKNVMIKHLSHHKTLPNFQRSNMTVTVFNAKTKSIQAEEPTQNEENIVKLYKCLCGLHFVTYRTVEKHVKVCKSDTNISKENCSQCGLLFPTDVLVSHLCSHHSNDKQCKFDIEIISSTEISLKCGFCKKAFSNKSEMMKHLLYCKTETVVNVVKETKGQIKLYKCRKCNIHYITKESLRSHFDKNHKVVRVEMCNICNLKFSKTSAQKHEAIHHKKMKCKTSDIKIIEMDFGKRNTGATSKDSAVNDGDAILYKCDENCPLHFMNKASCVSHQTSNIHIQGRCSMGVKCKFCELMFTEFSIPRHIYIHHKKMKLKRENFAIEYAKVSSESKHLHKCKLCKMYFLSYQSLREHLVQGDHKLRGAKCKVCRRVFDSTELDMHVTQHHKLSKSVNIKADKKPKDDDDSDDTPIDLPTKENEETDDNISQDSIDPIDDTENNDSSPKLYKCVDCSTHFMQRHTAMHHNHSSPKGNCDQCSLTFSYKSLGRHHNLHHEKYKLERINVIDVLFLYKCDLCEVHHWQENYLKGHNHSMPKQSCKECGLMFALEDLSEHCLLHHKQMKLGIDNFLIKSPEADSVRKEDPKPKTVERITLSKESLAAINVSTYNNRLHRCRLCSVHFLKAISAKSHSYSCRQGVRIKADECRKCGLLFGIQTLPRHDYIHHKSLKLSLRDFTIIEDEHENDDTDAKSSADNKSESRYKPNDVYTNKLYKCDVCKKHFVKISTMRSHDHTARCCKCPDCGLIFTSQGLNIHKDCHHRMMGLKLEDFHIVSSKELIGSQMISDILNNTENSELPKSDEKADLSNLINDDSDAIVSSPEDVSEVVDKDITTVTSHDEDNELTDEGINKSNQVEASEATEEKANASKEVITLYRCGSCSVHYEDQSSMKVHLSKPCHWLRKRTCNICSFKFSFRYITKHITDHHNLLKLKPEDFIIKIESRVSEEDSDNVNDNSESISNESVKRNVKLDNIINLYKCADCNVYFINKKTCNMHVHNHVAFEDKDFIECKLCGLQFKILTLHKHLSIHHKKNFNLENVFVEEYRPVKNGIPTMERYCAIDKIQSRLVSTTTEGKCEVIETEADSSFGNSKENEIIDDCIEVSENDDKKAIANVAANSGESESYGDIENTVCAITTEEISLGS